ncbi:MAG: GntR family transcriptional regulator [Treponema sp.]|nr:GntR family transcriptional regulator [Treponema sp.]
MTNVEKQKNESNRDYAFRVIKENIINLNIKPGIMISEQDIAEELNISRTPVHEALQELSKTKIVDILPQKGCRVSLIDMKLVNEAVFMRLTIESAVTEEACRIASEKDIEALEENVILQDFYKGSDNYPKIMDLDNRFHEKMYQITDKMQCLYMVRLMNIHFDRLRELTLETGVSSRIVDDHKEILQAMKDKNSDSVKDILQRHLNHLYIDEKAIRKSHPDYFSE